MTDEDSEPRTDCKAFAEKLRDFEIVKQLGADGSEQMFRLTKFIAARVEHQGDLVPLGVNMSIMLALYDVNKGVDGFNGAPIHIGLEGLPPIAYELMRMAIMRKLELFVPADFAAKCKELDASIQKEARAKATNPPSSKG